MKLLYGHIRYIETLNRTFRINRRDVIRLPVEDILPTRSEIHDSDLDEKTCEDRSQSGESGEWLPSPSTHSLQQSSRVTHQPNCNNHCAC